MRGPVPARKRGNMWTLCVVMVIWLVKESGFVQPPLTQKSPAKSLRNAVATADLPGNPLISEKKGRAGGGGDGDEPTPLETLQVLIYRGTLIVVAGNLYQLLTLDFFGSVDPSGSQQLACMQQADLFSGAAAFVAPSGSLIGLGLVLRAFGLAAMASKGFTFLGLGLLGKVAGPVCLLLILAREIYWYGVEFRGGLVLAIPAFAAIAVLRSQESPLPGNLEAIDYGTSYSSADLPQMVEPHEVGPPLPLSFLTATVIFTVAVSKVFDPIALDLDEEGNMFTKKSSRDLKESGFPNFQPDLSEWLPPATAPEDSLNKKNQDQSFETKKQKLDPF